MIIFVVENYLMISYPNAKINIGLDILNRRDDGYHNISSIFYPVMSFTDILEIKKSNNFLFSSSGKKIINNNICVKAFNLFKKEFDIPNVKIHLHKRIPICSGLGGGSSDASFTLKMLNDLFNLNLTHQQLKSYALMIGADCPFFIENKPMLVEGIGEKLNTIKINLDSYEIKVYCSDIQVSTAKAYSLIKSFEDSNLRCNIKKPISTWQKNISNKFEESIFLLYPELREKKKKIIEEGALYCSMSGTGSSLYAIFRK
jgi:4-diphosphocytidyl-2-C-methyl-D-erythritol kinase